MESASIRHIHREEGIGRAVKKTDADVCLSQLEDLKTNEVEQLFRVVFGALGGLF